MKEKHLIDKFIEFEEKYDLFDYKISNTKFWHYYRFSVYFEILNSQTKIKSAHFKQSKMSKLWNYLKNLITCLIFHNPFFLKKVDFILFNHPRRIYNSENDIWEEPYTDEFLKNSKGKTFYIFEYPYNGIHRKNVIFKKNIKHLDILQNIASIIAFIKSKLNPLSKQEQDKILYLRNIIKKEFGCNIYLSKLEYDINYIASVRKLINYLLKKTTPQEVYEVVSYDMLNMIINEVASSKNIPTIEFQHGTMGKYHVGYNYKKKRNYNWFPDKFNFFNEYWKKNNRLPIEDENKLIYGNPYMQKKVDFYRKKTKKNKKITIIIISQGSIGDKLVKFTDHLAKIIDTNKYNIIYKLHPSECFDWRQRYPILINNHNIIVIDSNNKHLYELFAISDIQIGVYSTAIFEGLEFGLKTYIIKEYGWRYMEDIINSDKAILIDEKFNLAHICKK